MATTEGTIAGDFWCIAYDEYRQRPRLPGQVAGMGLAGALLSELAVSGHLIVTADGQIDAVHRPAPVDVVARDVHDQLRQNPDEHDLVLWIKYLAMTAYHGVAQRVVAAGLVRAVRPSGVMAGLRRAVGAGRDLVYEPVDTVRLAWPAVRVANMLSGAGDAVLDLGDLTCAGLCIATGLIDHVLWDSEQHAAARHDLSATLAHLPPALAVILARTESAVGDAVLTQRT